MTNHKALFRPEALNHYLQNYDENVVPQFTSSRIFIVLWLIILLVIVVITSTLFIKIPFDAVGSLIVIRNHQASQISDGSITAVLVTSPGFLPHVQAGQSFQIQTSNSNLSPYFIITNVEPITTNYFETINRYVVDNNSTGIQQSAVIIISADLVSSTDNHQKYLISNKSYPIRMQISTCSLIFLSSICQ